MCNLKLRPTAANVRFLKSELTRSLPKVKSSHRCEAIARGLGYRTYAGLKASGLNPATDDAIVSGTLFCDYLKDHNFTVSPEEFYRAIARCALHEISESISNLTAYGIGIGPRQRSVDGSYEPLPVWRKRFELERASLVDDGAIEPFMLSYALASQISRTKTFRSGTGSYRLKHIAENFSYTYSNDFTVGPTYVPNGIMIAGAIHAGFKFRPHKDEFGIESVSVQFNMSKTSVDDFDCKIRPNGACAQTRERKNSKKGKTFL